MTNANTNIGTDAPAEDLLGEYMAEDPSVLSEEQLAYIAKTFDMPLAAIKAQAVGMTKIRKQVKDEQPTLEEARTNSDSTQNLSLWQQRRNQFYNSAHDEKGRFTTGEGGGAGTGVPSDEQKVLQGLDPTIHNSVSAMLSARRQVEPEYTKLLSNVAATSGGVMQGLPFKFKGAQGIVDKITRKVRDKGVTPEEAAKSIGDALRYTISLPPGKYLSGVTNALKALKDKGVEFESLEDNWKKGDAYNGINGVFKDKATGLKVELQFHTPESFHIKDAVIHKDYEFVRNHEGTSAQRLLAHERMRKASDGIVFPPGVDHIGNEIAGVPVQHLFRPTNETLFASGAEQHIKCTTFEDAEHLYNQGVMNQDDWESFVDGYFGYGPPWPGYIIPNQLDARKEALTADGGVGGNPNHDEHGRFTGPGGGGIGSKVAQLLKDNPRHDGEAVFEYQSRLVGGLSPELKHEVLFKIREHTAPVDYVAAGADKYRAAHGLPNPQIDITQVKAPMEGSVAVAKAFDLTPDQSNDPVVKAAFEDFKRQNNEMYDFITKPTSEGGLGVTVEVSHKTDPYPSAQAQADDLQNNHHFFIESGLGGQHQATMTTEEYDHFRAVHDIFGHAGIGGGFDRHGEYQAWLEHMSMYTGAGRDAMSSEYRGVNSAMWATPGKSPGTGKSVLLPKELVSNPWDEKGNLIASASLESDADLVIKSLGLDSDFAGKFDWTCPWNTPFPS